MRGIDKLVNLLAGMPVDLRRVRNGLSVLVPLWCCVARNRLNNGAGLAS